MKAAALALSGLAIGSSVMADESAALVFKDAGTAIYTNSRPYILDQQNRPCRDLEDAGDKLSAFRCYRHLSDVDRFLTAAAAEGPFPYVAWVFCTEPLHDDIDMGARCLIGTQHVCGFTPDAQLRDPARCIPLIQSGAVYLNPIARSYNFSTPPAR